MVSVPSVVVEPTEFRDTAVDVVVGTVAVDISLPDVLVVDIAEDIDEVVAVIVLSFTLVATCMILETSICEAPPSVVVAGVSVVGVVANVVSAFGV